MKRHMHGFTLVEIMVALALGLLAVSIAWASLSVGQRQWRLLDQSSQLQESERFVIDLLERMLRHASHDSATSGPETLRGWDNALFRESDTANSWQIQHGDRIRHCGSARDSSCRNGSDVLAVRITEGMPHCGGYNKVAQNGHYVLHVLRSNTSGEPNLACSYPTAKGKWNTITLLEGVESLQLLFGLAAADGPSITQWLPAHALDIPADPAASLQRWKQVRAVRIGVLLRGAPDVGQTGHATSLYPLGQSYAMASVDDPGAVFKIPADRRPRQSATYSFHLSGHVPVAP